MAGEDDAPAVAGPKRFRPASRAYKAGASPSRRCAGLFFGVQPSAASGGLNDKEINIMHPIQRKREMLWLGLAAGIALLLAACGEPAEQPTDQQGSLDPLQQESTAG